MSKYEPLWNYLKKNSKDNYKFSIGYNYNFIEARKAENICFFCANK